MSGSPLPWVAGDLTIDREALDAVVAHAVRDYPHESCGFLSGPADNPRRLTTAIPADNEADKYHEVDPETFPRTSKTYFKLNELMAARRFDQGERDGQPIKAIYHSHCDAGAHFSEEDAATFAGHGHLMWPCAFVVVSVMRGRHADTKLWVHKPGTNDFLESSLRVRGCETQP